MIILADQHTYTLILLFQSSINTTFLTDLTYVAIYFAISLWHTHPKSQMTSGINLHDYTTIYDVHIPSHPKLWARYHAIQLTYWPRRRSPPTTGLFSLFAVHPSGFTNKTTDLSQISGDLASFLAFRLSA